jgi:hypothetical protein
VARGSARNASRHGCVVAGPGQLRHQRRRCPDGDRHRRRGPRRQARATGPSGGRSVEQSSAGGDREPGRALVRVGAAIRVLHGSAFTSANVVPHAAGCCAVPVAIVVAVTNDIAVADRVYLRADADPERVYLRADAAAERVDFRADADPERVYLHADAHDERIDAHADAERVCLGYLGAVAHCLGIGIGIGHGVVVDGSAVGVSRDLVPTSVNGETITRAGRGPAPGPA